MRQKPQQSRSRQMVDSIVEATMQVIAERGVADLTTTHVAQRAGVSVGSLYQYFESKEALLDAVVKRMTAEVQKLIFERIDTLMGQDLRTVTRALLAATFDYADAHRTLFVGVLTHDSQGRTMLAIAELERGFLDAFRLYLLQHHREVSVRNLPAAVFVVFTSAICTGLRFVIADSPGVDREHVIDLLVEAAVACLTRDATPEAPAPAATLPRD
ncbi:TetR/AcrR family transcriptional regulator [Solimonas sp. K1W22B-7]|uniref:TetR/AcrR family transcriptional regulator n=1 Tax=Solimonas sp. K1W22B-7 TaxID=2303331 RepID=UPI0013C4C72A|nr:TetR/AcrR family transcriptional regulator [Solimonas sp. K1W22B-7]